MKLALEDVRIVEMGQLIAVPHAVRLLADMGAQVVRVESCTRLENYRESSFYENSANGQYWNKGANFSEQNRNKLGITLDLSIPEGLGALRELISISDVFVENFTPRVMKNFGLEYEDLRRIKPDIIMVSSTGYGHSGPWANFGALGYTTEAASGLAHMTGYEGGPPELPEIPYADYVAAEHTVFAIMAALLYRMRTGRGQFVDISQAQTVSATVPEALMDYTVNGRVRDRIGNADSTLTPHGCYPCRGHDKWIAIAVADDAQWESLCAVLDRKSWSGDDRFSDGISRWQNRNELDRQIAEVTPEWDHYELMHALQHAGVPAGAVLNGKQLMFDPHLKARRFYEPVRHHPNTGMPPLPYTSRPWRMSETPGGARHPAPLMGEHNLPVLTELLGKSRSEVDALEEGGVIGYEPVGRRPPTVTSLDDQKRQGRILDYEEDFRDRVRDGYGL